MMSYEDCVNSFKKKRKFSKMRFTTLLALNSHVLTREEIFDYSFRYWVDNSWTKYWKKLPDNPKEYYYRKYNDICELFIQMYATKDNLIKNYLSPENRPYFMVENDDIKTGFYLNVPTIMKPSDYNPHDLSQFINVICINPFASKNSLYYHPDGKLLKTNELCHNYIISHELRHHIQHKSGRFIHPYLFSNDVIFDNVFYDKFIIFRSLHNNLPWEKDANDIAREIIKCQ